MRILVTGASGWIGTAAVTELVGAGHQVVGMARSDAAAEAITALGAEVRRGSLDDPAGLRDAAAGSEGVVHLAYNHDFSRMAEAAQTDREAIGAIGDALAGTGAPFVVASGLLGLGTAGRPATEADQPTPGGHPRIANGQVALDLVERDVRTVMARFSPSVHGAGDHGFVATLVAIARERGVSAYIGEGDNRWPAVHRTDAARLVRLAVESAPAGSAIHAVGEEGVPTRAIAEAIGRGLGLDAVSIPADAAADHFGWIGFFFGVDCPASSATTRERLGWDPTGPELLHDIEAHYCR